MKGFDERANAHAEVVARGKVTDRLGLGLDLVCQGKKSIKE